MLLKFGIFDLERARVNIAKELIGVRSQKTISFLFLYCNFEPQQQLPEACGEEESNGFVLIKLHKTNDVVYV
jgi:hypothetical protein